MPTSNRKAAARLFISKWTNKGQERQDDRRFWEELLSTVFGVNNPWDYVQTQKPVLIDGAQKYIDVYIKRTEAPILIEQKSYTKSLDTSYEQSDGTFLTPYEQALRYASCLPYGETPKWIITCNFKEFRIYDNERRGERGYTPTTIRLHELAYKYQQLNFLTDTTIIREIEETEISTKAGELVGKLYDAFAKQYRLETIPEDSPVYKNALSNLNKLIVRMIFCFYAEDAEFFGARGDEFTSYIEYSDGTRRRTLEEAKYALQRVFRILETPHNERNPHEETRLLDFPYINGGLFADELDIPEFTHEIFELIVTDCGKQFNWEKISPTIFGAVFESTLNPETRRKGGMHYTSIRNIRKVIDPLFMDGLRARFKKIASRTKDDGSVMSGPEQRAEFQKLQDEISGLNFLDPACGSGNFLTESYIELRTLENDILRFLGGNSSENPIKVSISQFYGIEINDFAVAVAKTALWIAEAQMFKATKEVFETNHLHGGDRWQFFPLQTNGSIIEGNALQMDWNRVIRRNHCDYIMGNPPFVGYSYQTQAQKEDVLAIFSDESGKPYQGAGKIDYVACWFFKAAQYANHQHCRVALVATNSITQGEQVASIWKPIFKRFRAHIDFAYKTFRWDSEASNSANVHCVIIGFSCTPFEAQRTIFNSDGSKQFVDAISPYLVPGESLFVENRNTPICPSFGEMTTGNRPADGGFLIIEGSEYESFIQDEPESKRFIKRLIGSEEFINGLDRYCLWLVNSTPSERASMPKVMERINGCYRDRLDSPDAGRRKLAETPWLFRETLNPESAIIVPAVSSQSREYLPIGFIGRDTIATNLVLMIPNATKWMFAILTSSLHMLWMRYTCGRLKSDYRYSRNLVFNNFPWPELSSDEKVQLEEGANRILEARLENEGSSLANLYDPRNMPQNLRNAHKANDAVVMKIYGIEPSMSDDCIFAELMSRNKAIISAIERRAARRARRRRNNRG